MTNSLMVTRRHFLTSAMSSGAALALLAACGGAATTPTAPTEAVKPVAPAAAAATKAPALAATTAPAISAPTTAAAPSVAKKSSKVNLQFLFADGPPQKDKLETIVENFKKKNPDAKVEVIWTPWGQFETKIIAMHTGGTPPDFHQIDDDAVPYFGMRGLTAPVDDILKQNNIDKNDYHKMIWNLTTVQGKIMAMTLALKPRAYIYNVEMFDKAGIKAPTTWADAWTSDQLLENAKKLTQGDVFGYSWDYWIWDSIPAMNNAEHFSPDYTQYLDPNYADQFQWIADLAYKQKVAPPYDMRQQVGELKLFTSQKLAIWNSGIWNTKDLNGAKELKWDVMPAVKITKEAKAEASLFTFAIAKATKDTEGTAAFASYFLSDESQQVLAMNGDLMPTKTSVQKSSAFLDPNRQPKNVNVWLESLDNQGRWPFLWNGIELRDQIKPMVDLIWAGQKPAKDALEMARPKLMDLLKDTREHPTK